MPAVTVRRALPSDLDGLLALYDDLAEQPDHGPADRRTASSLLAQILADDARQLTVAVIDARPVGTADLLVVPNITHRGRPWAVVENVVVARDARRGGVGRELMRHLIDFARSAGCYKLQLTSGKHRTEAHAFYRSLGMDAVAEGFKIYLD